MKALDKPEFYAGNVYDKYGSKNPIERLLMEGFLSSIKELISPLTVAGILEVGCGEGHLANHISRFGEFDIEAVDLSPEILKAAAESYKNIRFRRVSAYQLPYRDSSFDLVLASEVLEHLDTPIEALEECWRVTRKYCVFSVPNEPIWRVANLMRLRYLSRMGNTPGHVQHWSKRQFIKFISNKFEILKIKLPFPWIVVLGKK